MNSLPRPEDYKKFFTTRGLITCLNSDFLFNGALGKAGLFLTYCDGWFNIFINRKGEQICLQDGATLFGNQEKYEEYFESFKQYVDLANKEMIPKYSSTPDVLTEKEFLADVDFIGKLWKYYGVAEFPYMDLAYEKAVRENNLQMLANLNQLSKFKFKAREVMNAYFFTNGVIENLLRYFSAKYFDAPGAANYLYLTELVDIFHGKHPGSSVIEERKKCYAAVIDAGRVTRFSFRQATTLNKVFTAVKQIIEVHGKTASPGFAKGRVVICPMLKDQVAINELDMRMKKGDVLIAETTSPDVLPLCKKASAIVAEQGGLLSHAAVVSRELGIPCVIQTEVAMKIFKNGDIVEVDANKGVVRKLK